MKKPSLTSGSKLKDVVESEKDQTHKTSLTINVDAKLLKEGKRIFGRKMGAIFEAALTDALKMYKDSKKDG